MSSRFHGFYCCHPQRLIAGAVLLVLCVSVIPCSAQEAPAAVGSSIADRLGSLRDAVFRKDSRSDQANDALAEEAASNPRQQRTPRGTGASSAARALPSGQQEKSAGRRTRHLSDLLPTNLFGNKRLPQQLPSQQSPRAGSSRSASLTRVGAAANSPGQNATNRTELDSEGDAPLSVAGFMPLIQEQQIEQAQIEPAPQVLAEDEDTAAKRQPSSLRQQAAAQAAQQVPQPSAVPALRKKTESGPSPRQSLDLREALISEVVQAELSQQAASERSAAAPSNAPAPEEKPTATIVPTVPEISQQPPKFQQSQPMAPVPLAQENEIDPLDQAAQRAFMSPDERAKLAPLKTRTTRPAADDDLHSSYQQPVIVSHVEGPRSILVGHEAAYEVTLENTSSHAAGQLSAMIHVPAWAEVVAAVTTRGKVQRRETEGAGVAIQWRFDGLAGNSSQALKLRLIPRSSRPLDLGVEWSQSAVKAKTQVQVQEPKLELTLQGPDEVYFDQPRRYALTIRNPGTGPTENISVRLIPPGGSPDSAASQPMGNLQPGEETEIELELTAREAGELVIQANATAAGGLSADVTKNVFCRKAELAVDWRGPKNKYAGTVAAYFFRVNNPGTASTDPVQLQVRLPEAAKFVAASEGHVLDAEKGVLSWELEGMDVEEEQFIQVRCQLMRPGANGFEVVAKTADGALRDVQRFQTQVQAVADLKLEVDDPPGPAAVGEEVVYDVRVRNRGTSAAENLNIIGLFSEGIDPESVEGAPFTIRDGRVTFQPVKELPPQHELRLRIRAVATQPGTHIFRAEALCRELDIKLAVEETTRFYVEDMGWEKNRPSQAAGRSGGTVR